MTLLELNGSDRGGFICAVGWAFEDSPWVAERAWENRPFATLDALHHAMTSIVESAAPEEQLALLRAHPDLGAVRLKADQDTVRLKADQDAVRLKPDTTGDHPSGAAPLAPPPGSVRLQADHQVSQASQREQAGAGLDTLKGGELEQLRALNEAYRERFGFPFLYAVKGSTTRDILSALERRLTSTRDAERQEALRQVYRIARFRLEECVRSA